MTHSPIAIAVMRINKINAMIPDIRARARVLILFFGILSADGIISNIVDVFTSIVMGVLLGGAEVTDVVVVLISVAELTDVVGVLVSGAELTDVIGVLISGTELTDVVGEGTTSEDVSSILLNAEVVEVFICSIVVRALLSGAELTDVVWDFTSSVVVRVLLIDM